MTLNGIPFAFICVHSRFFQSSRPHSSPGRSGGRRSLSLRSVPQEAKRGRFAYAHERRRSSGSLVYRKSRLKIVLVLVFDLPSRVSLMS
jgi:hypothetical protein